nr:MAG: hypothetical protein DIU66_08520 [Bacillota bacterium]
MKGRKLKSAFLLFLIIFFVIAAGLYIFADKAFELLLYSGLPEIEDIVPEMGSDEVGQKPSEPIETEEDKGKKGYPGSAVEAPQTNIQKKDIEDNKDIDVNEIAGNISFADRRRILLLVAKRLSSEDIKYLLGLLKGGLTEEEKKRAIELAYSRFDKQEIEEIKALYAKYRHLAK